VYISPDDAKSDVILAAATALFGGLIRALVAQLPLYPRSGVLAVVLDLVWILALTAVVPWLLSRYRGDGLAAFGLDGDRSAIAGGIPLALPVIAAQVTLVILLGGSLVQAVGGRIGGVLSAGGALQAGGPTFLILQGARFVVLSLGAILLVSFLATRSREAFPRSPEMSLTEQVRTFGMGAAALSFLVGLLGSLGSIRAFLAMLVTVAALVAVLLLADRRIPARVSVPRATLIAPAVIVLLTHIFAAGGLLGGGLINGIYPGALAAGMTIAVSALVQVRAVAWSIVPLLLAAHWWQSSLSPLAF
jgi:hypothetical protein